MVAARPLYGPEHVPRIPRRANGANPLASPARFVRISAALAALAALPSCGAETTATADDLVAHSNLAREICLRRTRSAAGRGGAGLQRTRRRGPRSVPGLIKQNVPAGARRLWQRKAAWPGLAYGANQSGYNTAPRRRTGRGAGAGELRDVGCIIQRFGEMVATRTTRWLISLLGQAWVRLTPGPGRLSCTLVQARLGRALGSSLVRAMSGPLGVLLPDRCPLGALGALGLG